MCVIYSHLSFYTFIIQGCCMDLIHHLNTFVASLVKYTEKHVMVRGLYVETDGFVTLMMNTFLHIDSPIHET